VAVKFVPVQVPVRLTAAGGGPQVPAVQTLLPPHEVPSGRFDAEQVATVSVGSQLFAYDLQGSGVPAGVQALPATQAAMQAPALQTLPVPHVVPSGLAPAAAQVVAVNDASQVVA
jgi:hypothetical protein